ncbi:hypothetical protein AA14337_3093 [Acetobacter malorum DSM 14337]|uniref:Uncharacterized protein n=1 Tax=Acetobacter malorum DSM 14337 TaxID=1307910 RepID=A0ABQ0PZL3_9PROT|nr:hypothetical protein [Acetobacter malorum]KXV05679.1 hypothetical protein AD930_11125 [Acetobacter malorum]GBQ85522.1 hypothetical protein AA14337_3093 [Acetobacter malorum DSM 14337]
MSEALCRNDRLTKTASPSRFVLYWLSGRPASVVPGKTLIHALESLPNTQHRDWVQRCVEIKPHDGDYDLPDAMLIEKHKMTVGTSRS